MKVIINHSLLQSLDDPRYYENIDTISSRMYYFGIKYTRNSAFDYVFDKELFSAFLLEFGETVRLIIE